LLYFTDSLVIFLLARKVCKLLASLKFYSQQRSPSLTDLRTLSESFRSNHLNKLIQSNDSFANRMALRWRTMAVKQMTWLGNLGI